MAKVDSLTIKERSYRMSLVRCRDTKPEMVVRKLVHGLGFRFRLHRSDMPGKPDLVFPKLRLVIFVHGCFWHQHKCSAGNRMPKSRVAFWRTKLKGNVARDRRNLAKLRDQGWRVLTIWECQTHNVLKLTANIDSFLSRSN
ncbi:MAG: DNA mismatch endonuclease Vsr [Tepidisphaeraceae bacterium]